MWSMLSFLLILAVSTALPQPNLLQNSTDSAVKKAKTTIKNCTDGIFSITCLKIEILSLLDKLNSKDELSLLPGVTIVKESEHNDNETLEKIARSFPGKPEERLDSYLLYSLGSYLDTHAVKLKMMDVGEDRDSVGVARKKDKKGMGGLMAAALMMKGTLMSVGMGGLAMLAGKALMTALMSLMLSAIVGLKALTSGGGKSTTYEIVSKPIYSHAHSHSTGHEDVAYGHSGYGRSVDGKASRRRR